jgi:membrane-associated phospholipid phosphatase
VYLGLYLRQHAFRPWRGDRAIAWWEIPAYAGLAALTVYVPYTRIADHKHHVSDVLTGAGVGAASALLFYSYQESRFRDAFGDVSVTPWADGTGVSVSGTF